MKTTLGKLVDELEDIKKTKCKTLQEVIFFDGVMAIIEAKYLQKEKETLKTIFECGRNFQLTGEGTFEQVYNELFSSDKE